MLLGVLACVHLQPFFKRSTLAKAACTRVARPLNETLLVPPYVGLQIQRHHLLRHPKRTWRHRGTDMLVAFAFRDPSRVFLQGNRQENLSRVFLKIFLTISLICLTMSMNGQWGLDQKQSTKGKPCVGRGRGCVPVHVHASLFSTLIRCCMMLHDAALDTGWAKRRQTWHPCQ